MEKSLLHFTLCICVLVTQPSFKPSIFSSRDPFAAHRQQMRAMFGPFSMDPFAVAPQMQPHRAPRRQVSVYVVGLSLCVSYILCPR